MISQSNNRDLQILQDKIDVEYPLANKLPFTKTAYQVVYIAPLTLQVELYETGMDRTAITTEINKWITSEGIDPTTHKLVFKEPSHPAPTTMR